MKRILCVWMIFLLALCLLCVGTAQYNDYYTLGDTVEDFTLTTPDGERLSLSGLLREHKAVLLNFWFSSCGPSRYEFPALQAAYELYDGDVEVLAVTPYDDDETILQYQKAMGLTFPMAFDSAGITDWFVDYGFPTNVLIDRNGVVCYIECGAQTSSDAFGRLLIPFVQEEYSEPLLLSSVPSIILPDAPDNSALSAALNVEGGTLSFYCPQNAWPWTVSENGRYIVASNTGFNNTVSQVETLLYAGAGDVLSFRFRTSTEEGSDLFAVMDNYEIVKAFSGENDWSVYALPIQTDGLHTITFEYIKNDVNASGRDEVFLDDVALLQGEAAVQALAANPSYPLTLEGMQVSLEFLSENAREIVIDDPSGMVNAYFHAEGYYVVPEETPDIRISIGKDCDPDAAFIRDLRGTTKTLSHCRYDENGFYFSSTEVGSQLGWDALLLVPSVTDAYGQYSRIFLYFESGEAVDAFCRDQVPDLFSGDPVSGITWHYLE
ncbi:MAG: TlpA family protein disulfide reductase [Clostridia bacterium]|nr:TlpA family protein disulfide reductase [Clostridia bacterium]